MGEIERERGGGAVEEGMRGVRYIVRVVLLTAYDWKGVP